MPDNQVSDLIFAQAGDIVGRRTTQQLYNGMPVCKSGITTFITCGTILNKFRTRTSSTCGCAQSYARAQYFSGDGDSGSPVYYRIQLPNNSWRLWAFGIHGMKAGSNRYFTRIDDALARLSVTLVVD